MSRKGVLPSSVDWRGAPLTVVEPNSWYGYDAFGRRVWREVFGTSTTQTHYIFDPAGHLLAEHDGSTGAVLKEYICVDDQPVAVIDSSSGTAVTYFIHTGPLNEPQVMTDATEAKVWDAYVEPFGAAQVFGSENRRRRRRWLTGPRARGKVGLTGSADR